MKDLIIAFLQYLMGYGLYLRVFSVFKISTLKFDRRKKEFCYFVKMIGSEANIVVAGACTGITTVPLAKGYNKRMVFAYEPNELNYIALKKVISHYRLGNVNLFNIGLGSKTEERILILPVENGAKKQGHAHIVDDSIKGYKTGILSSVLVDRLDNRDELKNLKIDAIKVVAENFELFIFMGAKELISKNKPVIYCELWNNSNRNVVLDYIRSIGYSVYFLSGKELVPYNQKNYKGKNLFFLHDKI